MKIISLALHCMKEVTKLLFIVPLVRAVFAKMSVINNAVILMYIAPERILLALLTHQGESSGMQPVVVVLRTNHLHYPDPYLEGDFTNKILYEYLKPVYRSRKATHANVEFGPGSFKHTNLKLPDDHLVRQFKKLLQMKEKMENKS